MESVLIIRITYLDTDRILIPGVNGVRVTAMSCKCYIYSILNRMASTGLDPLLPSELP